MSAAAPGTDAPFVPGVTVVRRDVHLGKVWSAQPHRAISDTGTLLELSYWPGISALAATTWTHALRTGDDTTRKNGLANLAAGTWELEPWAWRHTVLRSRFAAGEWFSLHHFQTPAGEPLRLYVNFERPAVRTRIGIDTLDLLVEPELVEQARMRVLGLLQERAGPFAEPWPAWAPDPAWPLPVLPDDAGHPGAVPRSGPR